MWEALGIETLTVQRWLVVISIGIIAACLLKREIRIWREMSKPYDPRRPGR